MAHESSHTPGNGRRWFAFLGGALAWVVHLFGVYLISEFGCISALAERRLLDVSVVAWQLLGLSLGLLLITIAATVVGCADARRDQRGAAAPGEPGHVDWLSRAGWILSALFAVIIVVQTIPAFYYLRAC